MTTYAFTNAESTSVLRTADDGSLCAIGWSTDPVQPLDMAGVWGKQWIEDGSPIPAPYRAPPDPELNSVGTGKTTAQILGVT